MCDSINTDVIVTALDQLDLVVDVITHGIGTNPSVVRTLNGDDLEVLWKQTIIKFNELVLSQ